MRVAVATLSAMAKKNTAEVGRIFHFSCCPTALLRGYGMHLLRLDLFCNEEVHENLFFPTR